MQENLLKYVVIFAAGAGVGFFVATKMLEDHYAEIAEEEIQSMKEILKGGRYRKVENNDVIQAEPTIKGPINHPKSSLEGTYTNEYAKAKFNYNILASNESQLPEGESEDTSDDSAEEDEDYPSEEAINAGEHHKEPYIIDDVKFSEEMKHYDKISLYYYAVDDILSTEDETLMGDAEAIVGYEIFDILEFQPVGYVRNERLSTDYEITKLNQSYEEIVVGGRLFNANMGRRPHEVRDDD